MGGCFSARVKTERKSPSYNGLDSNVDGRQDDISMNGLSRTSRTLKCFKLKELKTATRNLIPDSHVSEEDLYVKGWIDEHTLAPTKPGSGLTVALKKLNNASHQEPSEWLRKINNMGHLSYPNLVRLIGYCLEDVYPILVYEFVTKGSLDNHFFRRASPLSWKIRMKIALDAAKGLAFLHSDEVNVIHGVFRSSNILIDSMHNAKSSDFGLFKEKSESEMGNCTMFPTSSQNYAPEYRETGHRTKMGDVYCFGVVLLEIMSGKQALDKNRPLREQNLVKWVMPLLNNNRKIFQVMDADIEGQYSLREAMKVAHIAVQGLSDDLRKRPNMDEVVRLLEQLYDSNDTMSVNV